MEDLTVDDLVSGKTSEQLGEGCVPTSAILIVETMTEKGDGIQFVVSKGVSTWHSIGMVRSVLNRMEAEDVQAWDGMK